MFQLPNRTIPLRKSSLWWSFRDIFHVYSIEIVSSFLQRTSSVADTGAPLLKGPRKNSAMFLSVWSLFSRGIRLAYVNTESPVSRFSRGRLSRTFSELKMHPRPSSYPVSHRNGVLPGTFLGILTLEDPRSSLSRKEEDGVSVSRDPGTPGLSASFLLVLVSALAPLIPYVLLFKEIKVQSSLFVHCYRYQASCIFFSFSFFSKLLGQFHLTTLQRIANIFEYHFSP